MLIIMLAPMMPHLAEECWALVNGNALVAETAWPEYDRDLVQENDIIMPVQINGKKRAELTVTADARQYDIIAATMALDVVQVYLNGNEPKKIIIVPNRIVNVVL